MQDDSSKLYKRSSVDAAVLSRRLVEAFLFLLSVIASFYVLKTGNRILMIGLVALPFVLMLMNAPHLTLIMAIVLDATNLPVPGLSSSTLGYLAKFVLVMTYILAALMGRRQWIRQNTPISRAVGFYLIWMVIVMAFRGTGLRILGSETWGGTRYIAHFVAIAMFYTVMGMQISKRHLRWIIWGSLFAGFVGTLIKSQGYGNTDDPEVVTSRLSFLGPVFRSFFPLVFALKFRRAPIVNVILVVLALGMIGLTGFRSFLVGSLAVLVGYGFFKSKQRRVQYSIFVFAMAILAWGAVVLLCPHLPKGLQRALSFIPGTHVDVSIAHNATDSITWRFEIWGYCLAHAKQYLLVGRGMAFDVMQTVAELSTSDIMGFSPWFAYETHAYHSGPLSLLIDYGIPGLLIYIAFTWFAFRQVWRYATRLSKLNTFESRFALYLCVNLLWSFFAFFFVYGDLMKIADQISLFAIVSVVTESVVAFQAADRNSEVDGINPVVEG